MHHKKFQIYRPINKKLQAGNFTQLAQIVHNCRSWRSRQISTLVDNWICAPILMLQWKISSLVKTLLWQCDWCFSKDFTLTVWLVLFWVLSGPGADENWLVQMIIVVKRFLYSMAHNGPPMAQYNFLQSAAKNQMPGRNLRISAHKCTWYESLHRDSTLV